MANDFGWIFVWDGNDMLFNMDSNPPAQVRVTREALEDVLHSSGTKAGDENTFMEHRDLIFAVATRKLEAVGQGPITILADDLRRHLSK